MPLTVGCWCQQDWLVQALQQKGNYHSIAQAKLTQAANEITAYLKQQGGYF